MSTAFFDSHDLDERIGRELFDRSARASTAPVVAMRGAGMALSALLPDLAFLLGGVASLALAAALAWLPAGTWQPVLLLVQATVMLALGIGGGSTRWLVTASLNLAVSVAAVYALSAGAVGMAEVVLWQTVLAGIAFTGANQVPGWRQALGAQLGWLVVISLAI